MLHIISIWFTFLISVSASSLPEGKPYRSDYSYNHKTDGYYKIHEDSQMWRHAKELCSANGATLMLSSVENLVFAHSLYKKMLNLDNKIWIMRESDESDEDSDVTECATMNRVGDLEMGNCDLKLPYVCFVAKKDIVYDDRCDVFTSGYEHNAVTGSCYRFINAAMTWFDAKEECEKQQSHLLVVNSPTEHSQIKEFMSRQPSESKGSFHSDFIIIGFRVYQNEREQRIFRTIFNQTLAEAGYEDWSIGEPNNFASSEYCGSLFRYDGKLNDVNCVKPYAFICENEVH